MNPAAIELDDVAFSFGQHEMRFDVAVAGGTFAALMGPSGSGKSTLLNLIAGFETPISGSIRIGGQEVTGMPPARRPVSMVFQENNLFGHLDVAANVGLGRSPALRLTREDREAVATSLARVGLEGMESRLPRQLSGGERQRVALARVLVRERPVLLLDEPFASLGPALRRDMVDLVRDLAVERQMTVLMATHHPDEARAAASEIIFLENGRVAGSGPAALYLGADAPEAFRRYAGAVPPHSEG